MVKMVQMVNHLYIEEVCKIIILDIMEELKITIFHQQIPYREREEEKLTEKIRMLLDLIVFL